MPCLLLIDGLLAVSPPESCSISYLHTVVVVTTATTGFTENASLITVCI